MPVARLVGPIRCLAASTLLSLALVGGCGRFGNSAADHLARAAELRAKGMPPAALSSSRMRCRRSPTTQRRAC